MHVDARAVGTTPCWCVCRSEYDFEALERERPIVEHTGVAQGIDDAGLKFSCTVDAMPLGKGGDITLESARRSVRVIGSAWVASCEPEDSDYGAERLVAVVWREFDARSTRRTWLDPAESDRLDRKSVV